MMHLDETELNDYVDDALDARDAERVRTHLRQCAVCAAQTEQITGLKASLAQLPRDIAPERDLRPGMWRAIDRAEVTDIRQHRSRALWSMRYRLATAALLLIVASSAATYLLVHRERAAEFAADSRNGVQLVGLDSRALERQYSEELHELELVLRKSRGALAPETVRILEENLGIIDRAIREARAALAADPQSDMLIDLLRSAYERKLELLRQAAKSSPVT